MTLCVGKHMSFDGGAIYRTSTPGVMEDFCISYVAETLGLSLYEIAYGIGSMA